HQSSRRSDRRKLFSITASPSVAVVAEMAPRWMTASSLRAPSQSASAAGGTKSASWRLCRLRHLASQPRVSLNTTSARPASLRAATTFDPMKPAPPVTSSIGVDVPRRNYAGGGLADRWPSPTDLLQRNRQRKSSLWLDQLTPARRAIDRGRRPG